MRKRIKLPVLAVLASLVALAWIGSSAQASEFDCTSYPCSITGEQSAKAVWTFQGMKVECSKVHVEGELVAASESLKLVPKYEGCSAFGFAEAKVDMNGCWYLDTIGTTIASPTHHWSGSVHLTCPAGQSITITAPQAVHPQCVVHIPPQTPTVNVVDYENISTNTVKSTATIQGVHSEVTKQTFLCPLTSNSTDTTGQVTDSLHLIGLGPHLRSR